MLLVLLFALKYGFHWFCAARSFLGLNLLIPKY